MDSTVVCNKQRCRKEGLGRFHSNDYTRGFYGFSSKKRFVLHEVVTERDPLL